MPFNAKPLILGLDVFGKGTLTATDTDADAQFSVTNLINQVVYQLWKAASDGTKYITVDLNKTLNGGFETGDYSNWTQSNSTIDAVLFNSGVFSSKLTAAGAGISGAHQAIDFNKDKVYTASAYGRLSSYSAGTYVIEIMGLDSTDAIIGSTSAILTLSSATAFSKGTKTIGISGAGTDIELPAGSVKVQIRQRWLSAPAPTGVGRMDDVLFYENFDPDTLGIANHNLWDSNASVSIESSVDDTEVISSWTERMAAFTPALTDKEIILKKFTAVGTAERAWRLKIVTANLAAFMGDLRIGKRLTMPRWVQGPFSPKPRKIEGQLANNRAGQFIQRVVIRREGEVRLTFQRLTKSFIEDTLRPAFEDYLIGGMFYLSWDIDQHETHKLIGYMPDGAELDPVYEGRKLSVTLRVMPMPVA